MYELNSQTLQVKPLVEEDKKIYFADFHVHPVDSKWVAAINEDHHPSKPRTLKIQWSSLTLRRKRYRHLPKDGTSIHFFALVQMASRSAGYSGIIQVCPGIIPSSGWRTGRTVSSPTSRSLLAAKRKQVSRSLNGALFFIDDRTGYWQLYRYIEGTSCHIHTRGLEKAEFAGPDWWLGRYVVQYLLFCSC